MGIRRGKGLGATRRSIKRGKRRGCLEIYPATRYYCDQDRVGGISFNTFDKRMARLHSDSIVYDFTLVQERSPTSSNHPETSCTTFGPKPRPPVVDFSLLHVPRSQCASRRYPCHHILFPSTTQRSVRNPSASMSLCPRSMRHKKVHNIRDEIGIGNNYFESKVRLIHLAVSPQAHFST